MRGIAAIISKTVSRVILPHAIWPLEKNCKLLIINHLSSGRGADCLPVLILNKLLKMLDAQNYQNAGNAVLEYATRT